jgi:RNA polymerase sigma factor (sigma-70 family)
LKGQYKDINSHLIDACRTGDRVAQFKIYKLYYKAMYNTCLRIVNDTAEAEDIMQEAFLDAFLKIASYTGQGSFGSWLKRIVVNRSLDFLRRSREMVSLDESRIDIPYVENEIDEEEFQGRLDDIRKGIMRLPDEYRVVLSLFLLEGYDHEEISLFLNISNNTSRIRYFRAKQKLLKMIREEKLKKSVSMN